MLYITDFGAMGDGQFMNTEAFAKAISAAQATGETVGVPAGTFLTGTVNLRGVSLHLDAGAVVKGSPDLSDYPPQEFFHNEMGQLRALIINLGHDHVSITGSGAVDLNGRAFYDRSRFNVPETRVPMTEAQTRECTYFIGERPGQCIFFHGCRDIEISGITILDAPCWTVSLSRCENIRLTHLNIDTNMNTPNDDGIHLSACKGAIISDCHISSGDDCIALSCITDWETPCEDVVIANCVLRSCSKAIVVGYQYSVVRNVLISNCVIRESNRGLCVMCHTECGLVENVRVSNLIIDTRVRAGNWWGNGEPILITAVPQDNESLRRQKPDRATACAIRNIRMDGITCMGENAIGIIGANGNIRDVALSHVDYTRKPSANLPLKGAAFDLSPSDIRVDAPEDSALVARGAKDVRLSDIRCGGLRVIAD
ncbi:MAG: right-handed parallel beta-helix repeat-containing protein [Clostridia bacterium]|nr:right-handed parallel beta-helix repeat-containing protein [Clostridia bacterium]